jgi:hypothetical protein
MSDFWWEQWEQEETHVFVPTLFPFAVVPSGNMVSWLTERQLAALVPTFPPFPQKTRLKCHVAIEALAGT